MRICMIMSTPLPPGEGIGFYVWNLSKYLTSLGHQVQIITRGRAERTSREVVDGITIWRPAFLPIYPFNVHLHGRFVSKLVRELEAEVDIFHVHSPLSPVISTSRPVILTLHSVIRHDVQSTPINSVYTLKMKLQAPVSCLLEQGLLSAATTVNAVSPQVVDALCTYPGSFTEVKTAWNGVNTTLFTPISRNFRDHRLVLSVGRLAPGKGIEDLIEAAAIVNKRIGPTKFLIAGDGHLKQSLEAMIAQNNLEDNIVLLGHISDRSQLIDLYRQATLFVLPSHHEGLPTVVLEAMACGCPVVATKVGGVPFVIEHGKNGVLIPVQNPSHMANAVCNLLQDPNLLRVIGHHARQTVEERFSWEVIGQDYLTQYQALLQGVQV